MIITLFLTPLLIFFINTIITNNNLLPNYTGESHQKFTFNKNIQLSGGIFIIFYLSLIMFNQSNNLFLIFAFLIFFVGFFSDLRKLNSVNIRLSIQVLIIIVFLIIFELNIYPTRIFFLDSLLKYNYFNYIFLSFCILIIVNGSNFVDGLNTLNLGYFLSILIILKIINIQGNFVLHENLNFLIFSFLIIFIFNLFNKFYIGDSGAYLNGFFFSYLLINFYQNNTFVSPFFIALLLWYPSFEILFSIIRKSSISLSPFKPDQSHFHQLLYFFLNKKITKKNLTSNVLAANIINIYNLIIFFIGSTKISNTELQIILIIISIITYTFFYSKLLNFRRVNS